MIETKIKYPSSSMVHRLANAFGIDPETTMKNARKAVIEDFGAEICTMISHLVSEKGKETEKN